MVYFCDCEEHCHGVPTQVGRTTYYRHAPFRLSNLIQPVEPALVAAHFGFVSRGDPRPGANDSDINEVHFLIMFLLADPNSSHFLGPGT
jgi:hypothetical protein